MREFHKYVDLYIKRAKNYVLEDKPKAIERCLASTGDNSVTVKMISGDAELTLKKVEIIQIKLLKVNEASVQTRKLRLL